ncbi:MAG: ATPase [Verrucomicrobia bacterium]|nr:MAG: ATPase [Verrucomicrobiota bacterium]
MNEIKRIVIYGPESTGKSVLAEALASHYNEPWSREYVRQYWLEHDGVITADSLEAIGTGQRSGEERAIAQAGKLVFCDTDLLTCRIWNDLLFAGHCPDWVRAEGNARALGAALYLFCDNDLPWKSDPMRSFPDESGQRMCRRLWQEALEELGVGFVLIQGTGEERLAKAIEAAAPLFEA